MMVTEARLRGQGYDPTASGSQGGSSQGGTGSKVLGLRLAAGGIP